MKIQINNLQNFEKIPVGWSKASLKEILPITYGKGLPKAKRSEDGEYAVFGSSGQIGMHSEAMTSKPSLIVGRKGTIGAVYYSKYPCWPIDTVYYVEENENINLKFFLYLLKGLNLEDLDKSTAVPGLSRDDYNQIEVVIAPFNEQKRIVEEIEKQFSRLDEAVENLKRVKANLKRYRASVLKAAVEGKLTEQWRAENPDVEPAGQLLERILKERRKKWEENELAKMEGKGKAPKEDKWKAKYTNPELPKLDQTLTAPDGWCLAGIDQLLPPERDAMKTGPFGSLLKKHEHKTVGVPVLGIENISSMKFLQGSKIHISKDKAKELNGYKVNPGDIIISRSGTVGEVCVVPDGIGDARISTNIMKVSLMKDGLLPEFFTFLFNGSPFILNQIRNLCKGSTRSFLNQDILKHLVFVIPPINEQIQIIKEVEKAFSLVDEIMAEVEQNIKRADRLRQSILKKAFSGKLVNYG